MNLRTQREIARDLETAPVAQIPTLLKELQAFHSTKIAEDILASLPKLQLFVVWDVLDNKIAYGHEPYTDLDDAQSNCNDENEQSRDNEADTQIYYVVRTLTSE